MGGAGEEEEDGGSYAALRTLLGEGKIMMK